MAWIPVEDGDINTWVSVEDNGRHISVYVDDDRYAEETLPDGYALCLHVPDPAVPVEVREILNEALIIARADAIIFQNQARANRYDQVLTWLATLEAKEE